MRSDFTMILSHGTEVMEADIILGLKSHKCSGDKQKLPRAPKARERREHSCGRKRRRAPVGGHRALLTMEVGALAPAR